LVAIGGWTTCVQPGAIVECDGKPGWPAILLSPGKTKETTAAAASQADIVPGVHYHDEPRFRGQVTMWGQIGSWPAQEPSDEESFLATLQPSPRQLRLAMGVVALFVVVFGVTIPFKDMRLLHIDAIVPAFQIAITVNDLITAALLFSQFVVVRRQGLLVLACGYLFTALVVVSYALTFPGAFTPSGLLGAGPQSAPWLYWFWHVGLPIAIIAYVPLKDTRAGAAAQRRSVASVIGWSVAGVALLVLGATLLSTVGEPLLPIVVSSTVEVTLGIRSFYGGAVLLLIIGALVLLWTRRRSVLDLWLMVVCSSLLFELLLDTVFLASRYSLGWYASRIYAYVASIFVLIVLLAETTALYARLASSNLLLRRERDNKLMSLEAVAASISHEVRQPLGAIAMNGEAALLHLAATPRNLDKVRSLLTGMVAETHRASQLLQSIHGLFGRVEQKQERVDVNEVVLEALRTFRADLGDKGIGTRLELAPELRPVVGYKGQLQEVINNLVHNAIEALEGSKDDPRMLSLRTKNDGQGAIVLEVEDTGPGIEASASKQIFDAFTTTKRHGMGVGLAICQTIIQRHDGEISVAVAKPQGSIFRIVLPTQQPS